MSYTLFNLTLIFGENENNIFFSIFDKNGKKIGGAGRTKTNELSDAKNWFDNIQKSFLTESELVKEYAFDDCYVNTNPYALNPDSREYQIYDAKEKAFNTAIKHNL